MDPRECLTLDWSECHSDLDRAASEETRVASCGIQSHNIGLRIVPRDPGCGAVGGVDPLFG
jgi:hypothetical protein